LLDMMKRPLYVAVEVAADRHVIIVQADTMPPAPAGLALAPVRRIEARSQIASV